MELAPSVVDRDDAAAFVSKGDEHGMGEVEVLAGRVAPAAEGVLRAVIRGSDGDGRAPRETILGPAGVALQGVASAAREPGVEQRGAQRRSVRPVASRVQIPVSTCTPCTIQGCNQKLIDRSSPALSDTLWLSASRTLGARRVHAAVVGRMRLATDPIRPEVVASSHWQHGAQH